MYVYNVLLYKDLLHAKFITPNFDNIWCNVKHEYGSFNMKFKNKHTDQQYIVFILNDIQVRFDNIYYKYLCETILNILVYRRIDVCFILSHVTRITLSVYKSSYDDNTIIYMQSTNTDIF